MEHKKTNDREAASLTLSVTSRSEKGFRRCGFAFTSKPKTVTVTEEQAAILRAEKALVVVDAR